MTYLFFDIENANSFGGFGKICSFGYVLCNADFSIIETDDILINPDAPFDWYLFKKGSKCRLTHSRNEYQRQPKFPQYYSKIQALLSAKDRLIFGFGCKNDVATITTECLRYNLPQIIFYCQDMHTILEKHYCLQGSLSAFVEKLGIETEGMTFHDSRSDAWFTMKTAEKLAKETDLSLSDAIKIYTPYASEFVFREQIKKLFKRWLERSEAKKAAEALADGAERKSRRIPKKVKVPEWFDYRKELLFQVQQNSAHG